MQKTRIKSLQKPPRYTTCPLPTYRHIPGQTPHPKEANAHLPRPKPIQVLSLTHWQTNDEYLYGIDCFNAGYWWEAHEAWEEIWMASDHHAPERQFLQGLIQYAAVCLKALQGTRKGFPGLARAALARLQASCDALIPQGAAGRVFGLDLREWLALSGPFIVKIGQEGYRAPHGDPLQDPEYPFITLSL